MTKEQKLKMKEDYDLFISIFTSCNKREPKQRPFALGEKKKIHAGKEPTKINPIKEDTDLSVLTEPVT